MNLIKENNIYEKILINHLSDFNLSQLKNSEINIFKNKKILITASGVIGINLLFFK